MMMRSFWGHSNSVIKRIDTERTTTKHRKPAILARTLPVFLAATLLFTGCGKNAAPGANGTSGAETGANGSGAESAQGTAEGAAQANGQVQNAVQGQADGQMQDQAMDAAQENAATQLQLPPLNIIDDKYRTTYEIFVYSFYDSDGDGIGDLKGVTEKLDYINDGNDETDTDLGFNEIWLMPITPSTTYHKYDVVDYCDIDPEYGTLEDFDELLKACHDRGVRVILDTVFNHSSSQHPWFKEAAAYLKDHPGIEFMTADDGTTNIPENAANECPYLNYYTFSNEKKQGYEPLPGTDYFYEARFWSEMPDLNLDSDAVRQELANITDFWLKRGVDGFRLDATTYYYTGDDRKNIEFMTWLNDTVKSQSSDAYIVREAWVSSSTYFNYYESGIDSFFDFDYAGSEGIIAGVVRGNNPAVRFSDSLMATESAIAAASPDGIDAPFYTNHDMARSGGYYTGSGSEEKVKLAQGLNLLMAGNAFVYYGEELGMKGSGKDENKRAPMYWTAGDSESGMCRGPKNMDSVKMKYPAADEQSADSNSIYNYVKKAVRLRNTYPVIARGRTSTVSELSDKEICAFTRSIEEEEIKKYLEDTAAFGPAGLLIVINTSAETKTVDISKSADASDYKNLSYELDASSEECSMDGSTLTIPAYGIAVLTK